MEGKKFKCHFKIQSLTLIFIFFFYSNFPINPRNILKSKREGYYFMIEQLNKFLLLFENSYPVSCSSDPPHFFFFLILSSITLLFSIFSPITCLHFRLSNPIRFRIIFRGSEFRASRECEWKEKKRFIFSNIRFCKNYYPPLLSIYCYNPLL